ncbi:hypothetical protein CTRI78_v004585 [Colletotrichum trifolii]|uniref:Uncharacterized protein n=1 Tax=Colletotrichum trifolii TaxID=5466 RepID=A0A4R8RGP4_COLTR|nr:hypothetical protein CTRI78_v004585 [Colletotrichum trifolii]
MARLLSKAALGIRGSYFSALLESLLPVATSLALFHLACALAICAVASVVRAVKSRRNVKDTPLRKG